MAKKKNRHCQSKGEVIRRELLKRQQDNGQTKNVLLNRLQNINAVRPAMEQAKNAMRAKNRRESRNDMD